MKNYVKRFVVIWIVLAIAWAIGKRWSQVRLSASCPDKGSPILATYITEV